VILIPWFSNGKKAGFTHGSSHRVPGPPTKFEAWHIAKKPSNHHQSTVLTCLDPYPPYPSNHLATDPRSKLPQLLRGFFLTGGTLYSRFELGGALTRTIAAIGAALHVHKGASGV